MGSGFALAAENGQLLLHRNQGAQWRSLKEVLPDAAGVFFGALDDTVFTVCRRGLGVAQSPGVLLPGDLPRPANQSSDTFAWQVLVVIDIEPS